MSERSVECPRCGNSVLVPTTGEKVRCGSCGQKFRFDTASERRGEQEAEKAAPPPLPPLMPALPPSGAEAAEQPLFAPGALQAAVANAADLPSPSLPGAGLPSPMVPVVAPVSPLPERAVEPPALPEAAPPPLVPLAPPAAAVVTLAAAWRPDERLFRIEELRELWRSLCRLIRQVYEEGRATDADRMVFTHDCARAGWLAATLLPQPGLAGREVYDFLTDLLPKTDLDEIQKLSLEDFRHLQSSLEEADQLLERQLPRAATEALPVAPVALAAPPEPGPAPPRRRQSSVAAPAFASLALIAVAVAVVLAVPALRAPFAGLFGSQEGDGAASETAQASSETGEHSSASARAHEPGSRSAEPTRATTGHSSKTPRRGPEPGPVRVEPKPVPVPPKPRPVPPVPPAPGKRIHSRWKPAPDGSIALFDGKRLDGWLGADGHWTIQDGELRGNGATGVAFLNAREADWRDYRLALGVKLGRSGTAVVSHGTLAVHLESNRVRMGYPQDGWRLLAEAQTGLGRLKWYDVELDVKGRHVQLLINGKPALSSDRHEPLAGAPALEAAGGGAAFRSVRLQLHKTDPDYAAVVLGEGYTDDPRTRPVVRPRRPETPSTPGLAVGSHTLFNRRDMSGWRKAGSWTVRGGAMLARAAAGQVAAALHPGTASAKDYVLRARCRLTRTTEISRVGEYFLLVFRGQDAANFACVRIPIEGIFEIGRYRDGGWRQFHRGVQRLRFNKWHTIELTVRGDKVGLMVDGYTGLPTWTLATYPRGAVGVGVTGGEAAFSDVRVRILR